MSSQALNSVNYLAPFSETPFGGGWGVPPTIACTERGCQRRRGTAGALGSRDSAR